MHTPLNNNSHKMNKYSMKGMRYFMCLEHISGEQLAIMSSLIAAKQESQTKK